MATKAAQSKAPKAPKKAGANTSPSPAIGYDAAESDKWRAEDDMRTLSRAAEIRMDKDRMKAAQGCADKEMKKLASIKVEESRQGVKD